MSKSKRQKKKQQKRTQEKILQKQYGFRERQAREIITHHEYEREIERQEQARERNRLEQIEREKNRKKQARNDLLRQRREALREAGYSKDQIRSMQYKAQQTIEKAIRIREHWYLVVGYKDLTEETDSESLLAMKEMNKNRSRKAIINSILGWLEAGENQGYIGGYKMLITKDLESAYHLLSVEGYLIAYKGQGKYLQPLLSLIDNMMFLVYTMDQKDQFIQELTTNLRLLPYPEASANADAIDREFMEVTGDHF